MGRTNNILKTLGRIEYIHLYIYIYTYIYTSRCKEDLQTRMKSSPGSSLGSLDSDLSQGKVSDEVIGDSKFCRGTDRQKLRGRMWMDT